MTHDINTIPSLEFTQEDAERAWREWGMNCGPAALAAIMSFRLNDARRIVETVGFAQKKYMNPTMMMQAVQLSGSVVVNQRRRYTKPLLLEEQVEKEFPEHGLARIQWSGPWTEPGANERWAYSYTHWVASWRMGGWTLIYDINGGMMNFRDWRANIVPHIISTIKRADGNFFVTHSWEIERA